MKTIIMYFSYLLIIPIFISGQSNYIMGRITDAQTNEPVSNVNVFLGYTLIGTTTNTDGEFILENIPATKYELVVSHVQYEKIQESIVVSQNTKLIKDYKLEPKIYQLPEVVIRDDDDDWYDYFGNFQNELLGWTDNGYECEILNPDNIEFFDTGWDEFQAYCSKPLYIQNNALGYLVTYVMDYFYTNGITTKYAGIPYFQELDAPNDSTQKAWEINRHKAYCGSIRDFITQTSRAVISNDWLTETSQFHITYKPFNSAKEMGYIEDLREIMCMGNDSLSVKYFFDTPIAVYYDYQFNDTTYFSDRSVVELTQDTTTADIRGRTFDIFGMHVLSGYWVKLRLGDTLPMEYFPPEN